jgi:hypothetical protein
MLPEEFYSTLGLLEVQSIVNCCGVGNAVVCVSV